MNQQLHLFHTHVAQLRTKNLDILYSLFQSHTPSLATHSSELPLPTLLASHPATKLGLTVRSLQHHFETWQRGRTHEARKAFDQMLAENSFVEFWGRLGKIGGDGVDGGVKADDLGDDEGEGGGGKVDMKALAKTVDVQVNQIFIHCRKYLLKIYPFPIGNFKSPTSKSNHSMTLTSLIAKSF